MNGSAFFSFFVDINQPNAMFWGITGGSHQSLKKIIIIFQDLAEVQKEDRLEDSEEEEEALGKKRKKASYVEYDPRDNKPDPLLDDSDDDDEEEELEEEEEEDESEEDEMDHNKTK